MLGAGPRECRTQTHSGIIEATSKEPLGKLEVVIVAFFTVSSFAKRAQDVLGLRTTF